MFSQNNNTPVTTSAELAPPYLMYQDSKPNLDIFWYEQERARHKPLPAGGGQLSITCQDLEYLKQNMDPNSSQMMDNHFPVVNRSRLSNS